MSSEPLYLVSVNKTPKRAAVLVGQLLAGFNSKHNIVHIANAETLEDLKLVLEALVCPPTILICSSQWTADEQRNVNIIAKDVVANLSIINIPPGLDAREGSEGILKFLHNEILGLIKVK